MASVEEELGDGVYSLRWGGNRISVTSRSPLKTGQSLILKSETNAEGKPTLVVQGPALPEPGSITGRVIYGPGKNRANAKQSSAAENAAASRDNHQAGNQIAAGTSKATTIQAPTPTKPVQDLIGAVLEPLPEFEVSVKLLEEAVKEEKERLEEKSQKKEKKAEAENAANRHRMRTAHQMKKPLSTTAAPGRRRDVTGSIRLSRAAVPHRLRAKLPAGNRPMPPVHRCATSSAGRYRPHLRRRRRNRRTAQRSRAPRRRCRRAQTLPRRRSGPRFRFRLRCRPHRRRLLHPPLPERRRRLPRRSCRRAPARLFSSRFPHQCHKAASRWP